MDDTAVPEGQAPMQPVVPDRLVATLVDMGVQYTRIHNIRRVSRLVAGSTATSPSAAFRSQDYGSDHSSSPHSIETPSEQSRQNSAHNKQSSLNDTMNSHLHPRPSAVYAGPYSSPQAPYIPSSYPEPPTAGYYAPTPLFTPQWMPNNVPPPAGFIPSSYRNRTPSLPVVTPPRPAHAALGTTFQGFDPLVDGESREVLALQHVVNVDFSWLTDDRIMPSQSLPPYISPQDYNRPATHPPVTRMTLVHDSAPKWSVFITTSDQMDANASHPIGVSLVVSDNYSITVGDILDAIRRMLRDWVTPAELATMFFDDVTVANRAFKSRCNRLPLINRPLEECYGIRKIDLLGERTIFKGLIRHSELGISGSHVAVQFRPSATPTGLPQDASADNQSPGSSSGLRNDYDDVRNVPERTTSHGSRNIRADSFSDELGNLTSFSDVHLFTPAVTTVDTVVRSSPMFL